MRMLQIPDRCRLFNFTSALYLQITCREFSFFKLQNQCVAPSLPKFIPHAPWGHSITVLRIDLVDFVKLWLELAVILQAEM